MLGRTAAASLKHLQISDCLMLDGEAWLKAALQRLPGLEHLNLSHISLSKRKEANACIQHWFPLFGDKNYEPLGSDLGSITDVLDPVSAMHQLTCLELVAPSLHMIQPLDLAGLTRLQQLRLNTRLSDSQGLEFLPQLTGLRELKLKAPDVNLPSGVVLQLTQLKQLTCQRLKYKGKINGEALSWTFMKVGLAGACCNVAV